VFLSSSVPANTSYSHVIHFYATNHGTHWLCTYLYSPATKKTYAHAGASWTNT
jgi:hypothetical protein